MSIRIQFFQPVVPLYDPWDFLMVPLALLIVYTIANQIKKTYEGSPFEPYVLPSLTVKIAGGILVGVLYYYLYGNGDTFGYFDLAKAYVRLFFSAPGSFADAYFSNGFESVEKFRFYMQTNHISSSLIMSRYGPEENMAVKVMIIANLLAFNTYFASSIYLSFMSWVAVWGLFQVLSHYFPHAIKQVAIAALFIPSVVFWGSGVLKDCVTLAALIAVFYGLFRVFVVPRHVGFWLGMIILGGFVTLSIRDFTLIGFTPFAALWLFPTVVETIPNRIVRILFGPILIVGMLIGGAALFLKLSSSSSAYGIDSVFMTAYLATTDLHNDSYYQLTGGGSRYTIPGFDGTMVSAIATIPIALATTFLRPWLWEARNPVMLLAALESFVMLILIIRALLRVPLQRIVSLTVTSRLLVFMLSFSLFYGWMSALGSGNFGNLVRYKIPALPFFYSYILLIYHYGYVLKVNTISAARKKLAAQESGPDAADDTPHGNAPLTLIEMRERIAKRHRKRLSPGSTEGSAA